MQVRPALAIALATVTAITVSACSATPSTAPAEAPTPSGTSATPVSLPVAEVFDAPSWGVRLPPSSAQKRPVVTAQRLVVLDGQQVRALDPQGKDAWATPWEGFTEEARAKGSDGYPFLRLVSPDVVAVVDSGMSSGEGLDKDIGQVKIALLKVADGSVIKKVAVSGTSSDTPKIGEIGLGFSLPQGGVAAVTPAGDVVQVPTVSSLKATGAISVGATAISVWEGGADATRGFIGPGWDSGTSAPSSQFTSSSVETSDADRLLVARWVVPSLTATKMQVQVLDAATGKVLSKPTCEPDPTTNLLVASPNRQHFVDGPMRLDAEGHATCIGGGENQKRVTLTAVADDGRAFGLAGGGLADVAADGSARIVPLPVGTEFPIGVMDGGIAVHWDSNEAVITGNKIL